MAIDRRQDELFATALIEGTNDAVAAWVAAGPGSVQRLHDELTREHRADIPEGTNQRLVLDNLTVVAHAAASAYPDEFLAAFAGSQWDNSGTVISGLGAVRRPEVTTRLMRILQGRDRWARIQAAVALRGHHHRGLRSVLIATLDDPDDLVRTHVEDRLAELDAGDD